MSRVDTAMRYPMQCGPRATFRRYAGNASVRFSILDRPDSRNLVIYVILAITVLILIATVFFAVSGV